MDLVSTQEPAAVATEGAKRRQILHGARQIFLTQGFDAASMGEIARAAGVSKGTLYVYFDSKEHLFQAFMQEECESQVERVFALDPNDHDVEGVLLRLGKGYLHFLCQPHRLSSFRTVVSIAERMPELGKQFYATGPGFGVLRLADYFDSQVAAGVLAVEDCVITAAQFLAACQATTFKPMIFNAANAPSQDEIDKAVRIAVRTFIAAYRG